MLLGGAKKVRNVIGALLSALYAHTAGAPILSINSKLRQ